MRALILAALAAHLGACGFKFGSARPKSAPPAPITEAERVLDESRTLSALAALESALARFVREEKRAPKVLSELVPRYIDELPDVELGQSAHAPTHLAQDYPETIISDSGLDGSRLKDSGRWGYAPGPRALVFVDCVHLSSRQKPWYAERGSL